MKRIFYAVLLIAEVCGLLAFAPKKGYVFCASTEQNDSCSIIVGKTELNNGKAGNKYYKYAEWDGNIYNCLVARCDTQTILYNEY